MPLPPPNIGEWFTTPNNDRFEVVAVDNDEATIEIQYFDGTVEELDFDAWEQSEFTAAEPPEDYSGSMDMEKEDYDTDLDRPSKKSWSNPLDYLDQSD